MLGSVGASVERSVLRRLVALLVGMTALAGVTEGCGKSSRNQPRNGAGVGGSTGGADGKAGNDGASAMSGDGNRGGGGQGNRGGSGNANQGGTAQGGSAAPTGGTGGDDSEPAGAGGAGPDDCEPARTPCFEPCGGDLTGNWVLEDACFRGDVGDCPGAHLDGTARELSMSMVILDGGEPAVEGHVIWEIVGHLPPSCLDIDDVDSCEAAPLFFFGPTGPTHSSLSSAWFAECEASACGVCECSAELQDGWVLTDSYCVSGDVLWVGGADRNGTPKVSYKFRRRSCAGSAVPCAERALEDCALGGDCRRGRCTGTLPACDETLTKATCDLFAPDCTWLPDECWGDARCDFLTCEQTPGCELIPPVAPRCGGEASCGGFEFTECDYAGCWLRKCYGEPTPRPCEWLDPATCRLVQGCSSSGGNCTGTALCDEQTTVDACWALDGCLPTPSCEGTPMGPGCSELSVDDCHSVPGCVVEWPNQPDG